ncbi:hypothetical protein TIFTF001_023639 [Ficus carica]|uniref:AtTam37 zinc finger domain-containing protein n=1 Tax=Ficus carica TaxID=3494 RepID=A0AA88DK79_FICCA|nr:hypothetical protein TIFTF001_023639 [Ficus carica]
MESHVLILSLSWNQGVIACTECKNKLQVRISVDGIMEPPWKAYNVLRKMDYLYEASTMSCTLPLFITFTEKNFHIVHSMKDPSIAAFWLFTLPEVAGGCEYNDDVKKKVWLQYKALISIDPARAGDDPVIVKNVPYYKAKKALEAEAMKLNPPPRPKNWGVSIV